MTSSPPRSPDGQYSKGKKEETFLEKIGGTLVRKKRSKEVNDLQSDGRNALNNPLSSASFDLQLDENEQKIILDPIAKSDPKLQQLQTVLIDWINDVLVDERIIVKSLQDDLYDGQVLQKLLEKLANQKLNVAEVTQSTVSQRQKLQTVLNSVDQMLKYRQEEIKWNVDLIHSKCLWGILHLLVALVNHFDAPIQLPQDVSVALLVLKKTPAGGMTSEKKQEIIVGSNLPSANSQERDKFDIIFDHEPHKLQVVTQTLMDFVNQQLIKLNLEVTDVHSQFADGVYLVLLMGLLGNFFVPLHHFHLTPDCFEQRTS
uniref:beta-parvin-like isoform X2 n=1 Tax=Myxine glutinosa TaxID=7769 RepID=UPI00358FC84E